MLSHSPSWPVPQNKDQTIYLCYKYAITAPTMYSAILPDYTEFIAAEPKVAESLVTALEHKAIAANGVDRLATMSSISLKLTSPMDHVCIYVKTYIVSSFILSGNTTTGIVLHI